MTVHTTPIEISVLGPLLVRVGGIEREIPAKKQRLVLARLVMAVGQVVSPDVLIDALWGEVPPVTASKNLQVLIQRLRAVLGPAAIATVPAGYVLDLSACSIDALTFEEHVAEAERLVELDRLDDGTELLQRAVALWRGDLAEEFDSPWGTPMVARWSELRVVAQERLLALRSVKAPTADVVDALRVLVACHPHRESTRVLLVDALRRGGDLPGARATLDESVLMLRHELGLAPGADLTALAAEFGISVKDQEVVPVTVPSAITMLLAVAGDRFDVVDVLNAGGAQGVEVVAILDELEAMVDRGELLREIDSDGRVHLVRVGARVRDEGLG